MVAIFRSVKADWWWGVNTRTLETGMFPKSFVKLTWDLKPSPDLLTWDLKPSRELPIYPLYGNKDGEAFPDYTNGGVGE